MREPDDLVMKVVTGDRDVQPVIVFIPGHGMIKACEAVIYLDQITFSDIKEDASRSLEGQNRVMIYSEQSDGISGPARMFTALSCIIKSMRNQALGMADHFMKAGDLMSSACYQIMNTQLLKLEKSVFRNSED